MIVSNSSLLVFASVMGRWPRSGHWDARSPKESFRKSFYLPDMVMSEHSASNAVAGYSLKESWHEQWWGKPQDLYRWCKWPDGCHCYPSSSALLSETITFMSDSLEFDSWLITEHNTLMLNLELQSRLVITDLRWIFSVPSRQNVQFSRAERASGTVSRAADRTAKINRLLEINTHPSQWKGILGKLVEDKTWSLLLLTLDFEDSDLPQEHRPHTTFKWRALPTILRKEVLTAATAAPSSSFKEVLFASVWCSLLQHTPNRRGWIAVYLL